MYVLLLITAACWTSCSNLDKSMTDTKKIPMKYIETFQVKDCSQIVLEQYGKMSDESGEKLPEHIRVITDEATINSILALAHTLPDEGQIMKKLADVPVLKTTLFCKEDTVFFNYYNENVKTPATSFYAQHPKEEGELYELLVSLLK